MKSQVQTPQIDIPFAKRHKCWFCEEPCNLTFQYISTPQCAHPSLSVPCCKECLQFAQKNQLNSIWNCRDAVKDSLMTRYQKHLAIGINWTEQELEESEFECKALGGFKKSAWFMYTVARDRINAPGWAIYINGVAIDDHQGHAPFQFDGMAYTSVYRAIQHYAKHKSLDHKFLADLVRVLGERRFGFCIRLAQIHIAASAEMKRHVLAELQQQEHDN